jgi:hypothetical protein
VSIWLQNRVEDFRDEETKKADGVKVEWLDKGNYA